MKNSLRLFVVAAALFAVTCNGAGDPGARQATVAILKFATHPALDATEKGIEEALSADGSLRVLKYNANGNPQQANALAESIGSQNHAVIIAIATPAAQAISRVPGSTPLVYGAVADPDGAGLFKGARPATGIRNAGPGIIRGALSFVRSAFPNARRLGTLYNPSEQNSVYVQQLLRVESEAAGFELNQVTVRDTNAVASAVERLVADADVIYSANDNTVNAVASAASSVALAAGKPFLIGDLSTLREGFVAAVGLEYESLGRQVGAMALGLAQGTALAQLPPREAPAPEVWVHAPTARKLGILWPPAAKAYITRQVE